MKALWKATARYDFEGISWQSSGGRSEEWTYQTVQLVEYGEHVRRLCMRAVDAHLIPLPQPILVRILNLDISPTIYPFISPNPTPPSGKFRIREGGLTSTQFNPVMQRLQRRRLVRKHPVVQVPLVR